MLYACSSTSSASTKRLAVMTAVQALNLNLVLVPILQVYYDLVPDPLNFLYHLIQLYRFKICKPNWYNMYRYRYLGIDLVMYATVPRY
eukprot:SAG31_NODE_8609_length_1420_cov_1.138531_1_plen_88_part_00